MFNRKLRKENAKLREELEILQNKVSLLLRDRTNKEMHKVSVPIELSEGAKIPEYKSKYSAGADLYAVIKDETKKYMVIYPNQRLRIDTGIKLQLPLNAEAQIRPRSGMSLIKGLNVILGTIDSDFRSEIGIILHNMTDKKIIINRGDRLAQIVFNGAYGLFQADFRLVKKIDTTINRGGGFGSTGIR